MPLNATKPGFYVNPISTITTGHAGLCSVWYDPVNFCFLISTMSI